MLNYRKYIIIKEVINLSISYMPCFMRTYEVKPCVFHMSTRANTYADTQTQKDSHPQAYTHTQHPSAIRSGYAIEISVNSETKSI